MDACDVLTSLLLRKVPPSDDVQLARLGVLDAIIHFRTKGTNLRNLQLHQDGHSLLASPECRLCISNAIASTSAAAGLARLLRVSRLRQMCRSYRTRSTRMARRQGTRRTSVIPPLWRKDRGPSVTKIARYLGYGGRPSSDRGRGRDGLRISPNHPDMECFRDVAKPA